MLVSNFLSPTFCRNSSLIVEHTVHESVHKINTLLLNCRSCNLDNILWSTYCDDPEGSNLTCNYIGVCGGERKYPVSGE